MKFGRTPRKFDPRVPSIGALRSMRLTLPQPPPPSINWTSALPSNLGMFLNDSLGDCTCAGIYHARQVWSANANPPMDTQPDSNVLSVYEQACGYKLNNQSTDCGGNEQDVLGYWLNVGVPVGGKVDRLLAFLEIDIQNTNDVKLAIAECGVVYIGIRVPQSLVNSLNSGSIPYVWSVAQGDTLTDEGHCVVLAGYDSVGPLLISWGKVYKMTWTFFAMCVDEAYALADSSWISAKGTSPGGLTIQQLEQQMQGLR